MHAQIPYFLAIVASVTAISISGLASLDANAFEAQGKMTFPRIPGINTPLFSSGIPGLNTPFFSSRLLASEDEVENISTFNGPESIDDSSPAQIFFPGHNHFRPPVNLANVIPVPNITALLLSRNITNNTNVIILPLSPLPTVHKFLDPVLYHARRNLALALNTPEDVTLGIQRALQQAFMTNNPAAAINALIQTILTVYGTAINNCPFIFMCAKLTTEAASLIRSIITAIMTATII